MAKIELCTQKLGKVIKRKEFLSVWRHSYEHTYRKNSGHWQAEKLQKNDILKAEEKGKHDPSETNMFTSSIQNTF